MPRSERILLNQIVEKTVEGEGWVLLIRNCCIKVMELFS